MQGLDIDIVRAIKRMLRPVARLCIRQAIKLNDLIEIFKHVLVEVAQEELQRSNHPYSDSKVTAMTGVHRKDVRRIERSGGKFTPPQNAIAKIMVQWQHDPNFTTKSGKPRVLSTEGKDSEFAKLCAAVDGANLNAYTILFEMERIGIVEKTSGSAKLIWKDYAPGTSMKEGLTMLGEDMEDMASAVVENVTTTPETPHLHLKTEFDKIDPEKLPEIKRWILEEGSAFHHRARKFLAKYDSDLTPPTHPHKNTARIVLGAFSFAEDRDSKANATDSKKGD